MNKRLITSALCYSSSELDAKPKTDLTIDGADAASFSASETTDRTTKRITAPAEKYFLTRQVVIPWVILPHLGKLPVGEFCPTWANCSSRIFAPQGILPVEEFCPTEYTARRGVLPHMGKLPFEEFCPNWANYPSRSFAPPGQIARRGVLPHLGKLPVKEFCPTWANCHRTWANCPSRSFAAHGHVAPPRSVALPGRFVPHNHTSKNARIVLFKGREMSQDERLVALTTCRRQQTTL